MISDVQVKGEDDDNGENDVVIVNTNTMGEHEKRHKGGRGGEPTADEGSSSSVITIAIMNFK